MTSRKISDISKNLKIVEEIPVETYLFTFDLFSPWPIILTC